MNDKTHTLRNGRNVFGAPRSSSFIACSLQQFPASETLLTQHYLLICRKKTITKNPKMSKGRSEVRQKRRQKRIERKKLPLQWLYDRVNGVTLEGEDRPPCFLCLPPLSLKVFPWLLERNDCCICLGSLGCCASDDDWARMAILKLGATCNIVAFLGLLVVALTMINNDSMIALATATLTDMGDGTSITAESRLEDIHIYLGLRAAVLDNPNTFGTFTLPYDRFCEPSLGLDSYMNSQDCSICKDTTLPHMVAILVALVACIPTFGIDCTRSYSNFDVNCQKVASSFLSLLTLGGSLFAYLQFTQCLDSFYSGPIYYNKDGVAIDPQNFPNPGFLDREGYRKVSFRWQVSYGLVGLFLAMTFKSLHFICNCCIPTPAITRSQREQEEYEQLAQEDYEI